MVQIRQRVLIASALLGLLGAPAEGRKFFSDDPIAAEPKPINVTDASRMEIDALYDFFWQSFHPDRRRPSPAGAINTLGEVPDSAWFTNRHGKQRLSREQLKAGAGIDEKPVPPYELIGAKTDGITPGFRMKDARGHVYFVKPDPLSNPEMATAADVIVARFFHAIGYATPQNYIVNLRREDIRFSSSATVHGLNGKPRKIGRRDLDKILNSVPFRKDGTFRVVASLGVKGKPIGPFRYEGVRSDDPNDVVPHENRRDLRGLRILCAWLNHTDAKGQNSLDAIVESNGARFIQHYLIDFGSTLGSDSDMAKNARFGNQFVFPRGRDALGKMAGFGLVSPAWERARYPHLKSVGRFEAKTFHPDKWKSNYPNPAFLSALPDDEYWAAKIVMAFTDDDIRAIVETGEFSDPKAVDYITSTLAERRDKVGRACFSKLLALDSFHVTGGELKYEDLAAKYKFGAAGPLTVAWSHFDNEKETHTPIAGASGFRLPEGANAGGPVRFLAAKISQAGDAKKTVTVYLRTRDSGADVVGIERTW